MYPRPWREPRAGPIPVRLRIATYPTVSSDMSNAAIEYAIITALPMGRSDRHPMLPTSSNAAGTTANPIGMNCRTVTGQSGRSPTAGRKVRNNCPSDPAAATEPTAPTTFTNSAQPRDCSTSVRYAIGCGGKGEVDTNGVADQNLVALCDVDEKVAANTFAKFPSAKRYKDYRVMLEKEAKNIDAVTVSTPDHHHAPAALRAMRMGKHVYCQKPLTHTVHEARLMRETAAQMKVATQMGNQGHSMDDARKAIEYVQGGYIGEVKEVHVWTNRPYAYWPQGVPRPAAPTKKPEELGWNSSAVAERLAATMAAPNYPVPEGLAWDLFLGPAPQVPYHPIYAVRGKGAAQSHPC